MPSELLVNFTEFWPRLREDILSARDSIYIQTFALEGDPVGLQLSEALLSSRAAYVGGINFSEHNASWHDMMIRMDDTDGVAFLTNDFRSTWNGGDQMASGSFDGVELLTLDGRVNRAAFQQVIDLIDGAERSI